MEFGKITERNWEKSPNGIGKNHRTELGKITERIWEKSPNGIGKNHRTDLGEITERNWENAKRKSRNAFVLRLLRWRSRRGSNPRPIAPEAIALSN